MCNLPAVISSTHHHVKQCCSSFTHVHMSPVQTLLVCMSHVHMSSVHMPPVHVSHVCMSHIHVSTVHMPVTCSYVTCSHITSCLHVHVCVTHYKLLFIIGHIQPQCVLSVFCITCLNSRCLLIVVVTCLLASLVLAVS